MKTDACIKSIILKLPAFMKNVYILPFQRYINMDLYIIFAACFG